jgi:hypothetical protein
LKISQQNTYHIEGTTLGIMDMVINNVRGVGVLQKNYCHIDGLLFIYQNKSRFFALKIGVADPDPQSI